MYVRKAKGSSAFMKRVSLEHYIFYLIPLFCNGNYLVSLERLMIHLHNQTLALIVVVILNPASEILRSSKISKSQKISLEYAIVFTLNFKRVLEAHWSVVYCLDFNNFL